MSQCLAADTQLFDQGLIAALIFPLQIVEEFPARGDQVEQAAARVVVFLVGLEVLGQVRDTLGEDRNLDFRRTGIAVILGEFLDQFGFFFLP